MIRTIDIESLNDAPSKHIQLCGVFSEEIDVIKTKLFGSKNYQVSAKNRMKLMKLDLLNTEKAIASILSVLKNRIPSDYEIVLDRLIYKPGSSKQFTPWHQDGAYWNAKGSCRLWIALDDQDQKSGCMRISKACREVLIHNDSGESDFFSKVITGLHVNPEDVIDVCVNAGDVIIFSEKCIHGSYANESNSPVHALTGMLIPSNL